MKQDIISVIDWFNEAGVQDIIMEDSCAISDEQSLESIHDLDVLRKRIEAVECDLKSTALNMVFGDGNTHSKLVFVGEAPGAEEDKQGLPFVGQSGQLLNKAINAIGLKREDVYITNVVPWRPLGNRTPTNNEIELFRPYLLQHIRIIAPQIVVCLGSTSAKAILQQNIGISKLRGRIIQEGFDSDIKIIVTFHPAYLLRSPSQKLEFWRDFLLIDSILSKS